MYSVFINSSQAGIGFDDLQNNLREICRQHQVENRASAFAFIIYNFENENVRKILNDKEYYDSLNSISSNYLTIFSLFDKPTREQLNTKINTWTSTTSFSLHSVITNRDLGRSYKDIIETYFGSFEFSTPAILFFQVNREMISQHFFVELKEEKIEEGFLEMKSIIKDSIQAVKRISAKNNKNYDRIFEMLKRNVEASVWWKKVKKASGVAEKLSSFFGIFS